jgi:YHS domain-containing protein
MQLPGPRNRPQEEDYLVKLLHVATLAVSGALLTAGALGLRAEDTKEATCPVSGKAVAVNDKTVTLTVNGEKQSFCCGNCQAAFAKEPAKFIKTAMTCPVMKGGKVNPTTAPRVAINDNLFLTCCGGCPAAIEKTPTKYVKELRDPVSGSMFTLAEKAPHSMHKGVHYFFASEENKKAFDADPDKYSNKALSKAS